MSTASSGRMGSSRLMALGLSVLGGLGGGLIGYVSPSAMADAPGISATTQKSINKSSQNPVKERQGQMRALLGGGLGAPYQRGRRAAYGWTNMHAQRVARKKRSQAKHRSASRRKART